MSAGGSRTLELRCPVCGSAARLEIRPSSADPSRSEVVDYRCPHRCGVDHETLRQIIGTSDN